MELPNKKFSPHPYYLVSLRHTFCTMPFKLLFNHFNMSCNLLQHIYNMTVGTPTWQQPLSHMTHPFPLSTQYTDPFIERSKGLNQSKQRQSVTSSSKMARLKSTQHPAIDNHSPDNAHNSAR
jgi:hypothetical protein